MKVSMWMLYDLVATECVYAELGEPSKQICIKGVLPYLGPDSVLPDYLYVADATGSDEFEVPTFLCYIATVGSNYRINKDSRCQLIVMNPKYSFAEVLHTLGLVFSRYMAWLDALQSELYADQNLDKLCEIGYTMLDNSVMIYDKNYRIIGNMVIENDTMADALENQGPYPAINSETMRNLMNDPEFRKAFHVRGAGICNAAFFDFSTLFVNLGKSNVYEGRLIVTNHIREFQEGDFQIAEILADAIRVAMKNREARSDDLSRVFRSFIAELIGGKVREEKRLADSLRLWHWKRRDRYLCIRAGLIPGVDEASSSVYICSVLETSLQRCCAVRYDDCIAVIIYLSENCGIQEIVEYLGSVLFGRIPLVSYIAVSNIFEDISEAHDYYIQTDIACKMGKKHDPDNWCWLFKDYMRAHYLQYGTSVLPAVHFCDENVKALMKYKGAKTDYYKTLKAYLENNMSLLYTSIALGIHRTTLFDRLNHIRELISADLNDPANRISMLTSFGMMEIAEMYGKAENHQKNSDKYNY